MTWISDANGNKCSVEYYGTREVAQKVLDSLKNCSNCSNCFDCSDCVDCSDCFDCSDCSRCSGCSNCSDCVDCSDCFDCFDCSDCSRCSRCFGCLNVAWLRDKKDLKGDLESTWSGPPPIPKIEDIHKKIYEAASIPPEALDMYTWHTCGTTHCRGGWAVHLAGKPGYELEKFHGTLLAAQLIYRESGYAINPCRFFDSNEDALADMKQLAEQEAKS